MDVNQTLADLRGMALSYRNGGKWDESDTTDFIELFEALDGWISRGGFLPSAWNTIK